MWQRWQSSRTVFLIALMFITLLIAGQMVLWSTTANATPAFARRYGTSCQTCHVAFPKLNAFGDAFRNLGYQLPDETEELIKQPEVKLGAEAYKRVWPESVWPGVDGPNTFNISVLSIVVFVGSAVLLMFHAWPVASCTILIYLMILFPLTPLCPATLKTKLIAVPLSDWIMTWFVLSATFLTVIGVYFRGPGWGWIWPWQGGGH